MNEEKSTGFDMSNDETLELLEEGRLHLQAGGAVKNKSKASKRTKVTRKKSRAQQIDAEEKEEKSTGRGNAKRRKNRGK